MPRSLLFLNALSDNAENAHYDHLPAQQLVAQQLGLPLGAVQVAWVEVDMPAVKETIAQSRRVGKRLVPVEAPFPLLTSAGERLHLALSQVYCVVVWPGGGHAAALESVMHEVARLTGQSPTPVFVVWREESGALRFFYVIPEPDRDKEFAAALQQTKTKCVEPE